MHDASAIACLAAAAFCAFAGMGWLALAMPAHSLQVWGTLPVPRRLAAFRALGGVALVAALACCLGSDHATMAVLVWTMLLAVSAVAVALVLARRPRALRALAPWMRPVSRTET